MRVFKERTIFILLPGLTKQQKRYVIIFQQNFRYNIDKDILYFDILSFHHFRIYPLLIHLSSFHFPYFDRF